MGSIAGRIEPNGPFIDVTVMATHLRISTLRAMGLPCPAPVVVRALIDTGAQGSLLDPSIISRLGLTLIGSVPVHTPSTGSNYTHLNQYDASLFLGNPAPGVVAYDVGVLASDLASEGFLAIIGWDILGKCVLTCDGPAGRFRLDF